MHPILGLLDRLGGQLAVAGTAVTKLEQTTRSAAVRQYIIPTNIPALLSDVHERVVRHTLSSAPLQSSALVAIGSKCSLFEEVVSIPLVFPGLADPLKFDHVDFAPWRQSPGPAFIAVVRGELLPGNPLLLEIPLVAIVQQGKIVISLFSAPIARGTPQLDALQITRRTANEAARRLQNFASRIDYPASLAGTKLEATYMLALQDGTLCLSLIGPAGGTGIALESPAHSEDLRIDIASDLLTSVLLQAASRAGYSFQSAGVDHQNQRIICSFRQEIGSADFEEMHVGFTARVYGKAKTTLRLEPSPTYMRIVGNGRLFDLDFDLDVDFHVGPVSGSAPPEIVDRLKEIGNNFVKDMPSTYETGPICYKLPIAGLRLEEIKLRPLRVSLTTKLPPHATLRGIRFGNMITC